MREVAGQQFVEDDGQRVDVTALARRIAGDLLRAGIAGRHDHRRLARRRSGRNHSFDGIDFGDAEINQLHVSVGSDQDVVRFNVAVSDGMAVQVFQGLTDFDDHPDAS